MSTLYSIGLMNQLGDAFEKAGLTQNDVTELRTNSGMLGQLKDVLTGRSEIVAVEHIINLDADPDLANNGWTIEEHVENGQFRWDSTKVQLYLSESQRHDRQITGHQLREELKGKHLFNDSLLAYLKAHPELVPEEWKGKCIFFWGTIYRHPDGSLHVKYNHWHRSNGSDGSFVPLDSYRASEDYAAVLEST